VTDFIKQQVQEGIDAVIVDSVLKIRNGLTKNAKVAETSQQTTHQINGVNGVNGPVVV
jgi:glycerophosphodiester phosphodiesterase